jgi:flagellar hook-length control protein FliK
LLPGQAEPQASSGPATPLEAAVRTGGLGTLAGASSPQDTPANADGDQPRPEGRPGSGAPADGGGRQLRGSAELASGKGVESTPKPGTPQPNTAGPAALGRAAQVQAAVSLENITGHAPVAQATTATTAVPTGGAEGLAAAGPEAQPQVQDQQLIGRVVRGLSAMIGQRGGVLNMRLQPPELGQLRVQMTIARGVVTAQFQPATAEVQAILDRSLATLRTALESHGLAVERLSVHSAQPAGGTTARDAAEEQAHQQQRHHADAGEGRSRGRGDGQGEPAPRRWGYETDHEFEMPQPAPAAAGADES